MKLLNLIILLSIVLSPITLAATIHGKVYDISLNTIKNIIVEIDTKPAQRFVSKAGDYSFEVPKGTYTITAKKTINSAVLTNETITVSELEGDYVVDLFIVPEFEEKPERPNYLLYIIIGLIILAALVIIFKRLKKKPKSSEEEKPREENLDKILRILKESEGRINQKELRKHFPLSEAKVSLLIAQLENEGKIEKIKKGRGNILILK